ncbi:peptidylprolyl isomerase [Jatrophihabitans sp. GAS493]|uniref:FKBP-type peptidyl-prolyl cis-trans isomerase n=1 Tax=Jatrophihabitans sp. GAS493 TaxID=1907575 RepID=UPI000BBF79FE|nr:FKBP-type peptidyl-prolyl cis-trans isomerase [Jatrophihabitans sp. GAS493]SOD71401.1 peptidylprolyl isomerase [Jatrophihabitans sp. GAS493]
MSKRITVAAGALLALALVLTGCASKSKPATSAASGSASVVSGATATFKGVTVENANDITKEPKVTSKSTDMPTELEVDDLIVGGGAPATPTSTVKVQYVGARLSDGYNFDSSWSRGEPTSFPLTGVVPGFTQGIAGTDSIPAMKVGGRRIMILPPSLAYGASGQGADIPPNTPLVFVVDLLGVS